MAAIASFSEYWLESFVFGQWKHHSFFMCLGLFFVMGGQVIRTLAMFTCGEHFSHEIMEQKTESHKLVTTGIYSILRHPSYFGWFYWSIGTQILLCNPVSFVFYVFASWSFFNTRIPYEEDLLFKFYKKAYSDYAERTYIGIPFISSSSSRTAAVLLAGKS